MPKKIKLLNKNKCFIIAEAGANHNGDINKAIKLAFYAKKSGADAVKFQLFNVDEQVSKDTKTAPYQNKNKKNILMKNLAKTFDLEWQEHIKIKKYCDKIGIHYLASVFDKHACNFLISKIKINIIKIGSGEITNYPLLQYISLKAKIIILSTGMATFKEIEEALKIIKVHSKNKCKVILMHCISSYPSDDEILNLNVINTLKDRFDLHVGFSDHSIGSRAAVIAKTLGCLVIEKHFTLNKKMKGPDHFMSLSPKELSEYVNEIRLTETILGDGKNKISKKELKMIEFARRSIVAKNDLKKGTKIKKEDLTLKRPGNGIQPYDIKLLIGKKVKKNIKEDSIIKWNYIVN